MDTEKGRTIAETVTFYPRDFFSKTINEPFMQMLMKVAFPNTHWKKGSPTRCEPDYFCDGKPFEFTIASNSIPRPNFIAQLKQNNFSTDDLENEVLSYIKERIDAKALIKYSVTDINLCVLCVMDMFPWVSDNYGSQFGFIFDNPRDRFFAEIKQNFMTTNIFKNIFILFPDLAAKWWIWDVAANRKTYLQLTERMIESGEYPFVMLKDEYESFFKVGER